MWEIFCDSVVVRHHVLALNSLEIRQVNLSR